MTWKDPTQPNIQEVELGCFPDAQHILDMLPDEQPSPEQIKIWQAMSGVERLRLAESLYKTARKAKAAGVRAQHPDWPEEQVNAEVRRIFIHAQS